MKKKTTRVVSGVVPLLLSASICTTATAVPVDGGTLDPTTIPKYVTPLVIPPVMKPSAADPNTYDIAVRQFQQQILPGGIWAGLPGCAGGGCTLPATTVWSYGPDADPTPAVAPAANSQFNYPAYTFENTKDMPINVNWINDLVDDAGNALPHLFAVDQSLHWANPAADCVAVEPRTDCHGTTDQPYTGPVPMITHVHGTHVSSDSDGYTEAWWLPDANNITCVPRDVDGLLTAQPTGYDETSNTWNVACEGTIANQLTDRTGTVVTNTNAKTNPDDGSTTSTPGVAHFSYQNDQPSATLWYHDHTLGMTRLNVYAGPAGFWLVRDPDGVDGETGLGAGSILPGPAPVAGQEVLDLNVHGTPATPSARDSIREIPVVIQDRSFNEDGSLFYPDNRAFFEGLNVEGSVAAGTEQFPGAPELKIDMDPATSDIAPIWNPEAFFNTMVVNGVTWPKLEVAPALYRFRLLNGSNSRFLNLALIAQGKVMKTVWKAKGNGTFEDPKQVRVKEMEFFQIGTEQSLLPNVVAVSTGFATPLVGEATIQEGKVTNRKRTASNQQALLLGLAERADVLVDFRGMPDGAVFTMTNTAPDAPFGGFPDVPADPGTTGQVMQFTVNQALLGVSETDELRNPNTGAILNPDTAATPPENLTFTLINGNTVNVTNPVPRQLALVEEESAVICADVDVLGNVVQLVDYIPVAGACVSNIDGTTHPTALPFAPKAAVVGTVDASGVPTVQLWSDPITTNVNADRSGTQTAEQWDIWNFTVDGHPIHVHLVKFKVLSRSAIGGGPSIVSDRRNRNNGVQAWENGWKDTVISYPGEITSISADFDINGLYVWHCHIVEHEDNEMMVPMCVGKAGVDCPAQLF